MLTYSLRRLLWTPVLLLIISFFVFLLGTYGPGDPVEVRLGHNYTPERAERLRDRLGLNDPFFVQYIRFVGRAVRGDLGESLTFQNRDVITLIAPKLLTSAQLNIAGSIIAIGFGVPLGFYAARRQGTWIDPTLVFCALIIFALPVFFTGPFAILIFAVNLDWVPVSGWGGLFDYRVVLPALTTGLPGIAIFVRLMRASTLDVLGQEYIQTARSKGLSAGVVNYRHVARNALLPIVTILGFTVAGLFGGSLITELMFGIPGIGRLALESVFSRDYPVIMALTLLGATALVVANLIIDIVYTIVDPRIRLQ